MNLTSTTTLAISTLATALLLVACQSELDNKPTAQVSEASAATTTAPAKAPVAGTTVTLKPNMQTSKLGAVGAKLTGDHTIEFKGFDGSVDVKAGAVTSAQFTIDMALLEADHPKLTGHLKAPDFFDVSKFPTASFKSTSITKTKGATHAVTGTLQMKGITKIISVPLEIQTTADSATLKGAFKIDRQLWGLSYPGKPDDLIKDDVLIKVDLDMSNAASKS